MTESRCLGNARTSRKGKVQVYVDEDMYDAIADLQANKDSVKMLKYIENLTKHNSSFSKDFDNKLWDIIVDIKEEKTSIEEGIKRIYKILPQT